MKARIVVLASGGGSNLQAILDACATDAINGRVDAVLCDVADAHALQRARDAEIAHVHYVARPATDDDRRSWDSALADLVEESKPDWIVLAGFMRLLSSDFLDRFSCRVLNLHPALPGELPGVRAIERAFEEAQQGLRTSSGVMVHLVPDEGIDDGPVLGTQVVPIFPDDDFASFAERMHTAERSVLVDALRTLCDASRDDLTFDGKAKEASHAH
jgi:phosphoribosylglycinamide formyltransferase 1